MHVCGPYMLTLRFELDHSTMKEERLFTALMLSNVPRKGAMDICYTLQIWGCLCTWYVFVLRKLIADQESHLGIWLPCDVH